MIQIRLEVSPPRGRAEELVGRARFINEGNAPIPVVPAQLESPSLALEVVDDQGRPVPMPPPPIPDPSSPTIELAPDEPHRVDYPGFLPSWTQPGEYRVRVRLAGIAQPPESTPTSDWVTVTVVA